MSQFENLKFPFGSVQRRRAPIVSPTLLAIPESQRPEAVLACMTCPAGSWSLDSKQLACHCAARRYISWLPKQEPLILCDDREAALSEQDMRQTG